MAVKDKGNGAKHKGRLAKDGPVRAIGQAAAVAGTSGVLLLALKAAVLVSPAVLPHAAGAGLNALGIPNALSAIGDTSGALAGNADEPVVFAPASVSQEQGFGDTQPTTSRRGTSTTTTTPSNGTNNPSNGTTSPIDNGNNNSDDEDETGDGTATPPIEHFPGGTTNPPAGNGSNAPKKGLVGGVVDTVGNTLPAVKTLTEPLGGVTDTVDKTVAPVVDTVVKTVTVVPVVGPAVKDLTDTLGVTQKSTTGGASSPDILGGTVGKVTGTLGGITGGLGLGLG